MSSYALLKEYIRAAIMAIPDSRKGYGYSHLGPAKASGMEYKTGAEFPYRSADKFAGDELEDEDELPIDEDDYDRFLAKTLSGYLTADPIRRNVGDRFAYATGSTRLGEDVSYQQIYTMRTRSQKNTPGTTRGLSSAPPPVDPNEENDDPVYSLKDLAVKLLGDK